MIPKIIHYCWLSGDPIPENLQTCMQSWKKFLPEYKFMLWDLNKFDITQSQWTKEAFQAKKYAFAADYIRLFAVYNYGGIYMDMDVEVIKKLDELLDSPYILGYETDNSIEAGIFGAEPSNPLIKQCLDYYTDRSFIKSNGGYDIRPLPTIMMEIMSRNCKLATRKKIQVETDENKLYLFTPDFLTAKSHETGEINVTSNTYTIHHFAGTWVSKSARLKEKIYRLISKNSFLMYIYNNTYKKFKNS